MFGGAAAQTSSTSQPAQQQHQAAPAQPQSRLANKSLDEILTTWSTSLATHQSKFAKLATQVSTWDRELTTNASSISKLYARCFQAERDVAEVERQLSVVEGGQKELESKLDRYESEVDALLEQAGLGETPGGGVDAERQATYQAAENCSERLTEMNQSLTAMIEGINEASTKLATTSKKTTEGAEDPLTQIVRVLNSHLAQLQVIDSGAADLGKRVERAQQEAGVAGSRLGGSVRGGDALVEGFGQSYLGRRGEGY